MHKIYDIIVFFFNLSSFIVSVYSLRDEEQGLKKKGIKIAMRFLAPDKVSESRITDHRVFKILHFH